MTRFITKCLSQFFMNRDLFVRVDRPLVDDYAKNDYLLPLIQDSGKYINELITNFRDIWWLLDRFLPLCSELRLSLTFRFNKKPEFAGWTIPDLNSIFHKYCIQQGRNKNWKPMFYGVEPCLSNNRNVYLISLKGDL